MKAKLMKALSYNLLPFKSIN